ncbi:GNAT family N-acetyltransferase [Flagellimonas hymeniacidonis]|nr:GNAT family N-acetyltransferase [Flagellimonas hymeniacidonis]
MYQMLGGTMAPAVYYNLDPVKSQDLIKKVMILYNIPSYYEIAPQNIPLDNRFKCKVVKEYQGYLCNLKNIGNVESYLKEKLSAKALKNFKTRKKRLEKCFDISYVSHDQNIDRQTFNLIFSKFKILLKKKFDEKKEYFESLKPKIWDFNHELVYNLLKEKSATLDVVYNGNNPISIRLIYHFGKISHAITPVYDRNYAKFGLGTVGLIKSIEYCLDRGSEKFDLGKGEYGYKKNWTDEIYQHEHHIYYDNSSISCKILMFGKSLKFRLIQSLRNVGFNNLYHAIRFYAIVGIKKKDKKVSLSDIEDIVEINLEGNEKVDFLDSKNAPLMKGVVEFIYSSQEHYSKISIFKSKSNRRYYIRGERKQVCLTL